MIIKSITIENLGVADSFSWDFLDDLNIVKSWATEEVAQAINIVLNRKFSSPLSCCLAREDMKIRATVSVLGKIYFIQAVRNMTCHIFLLSAVNQCGEDATAEYLYLTSHCQIQDEAETFDGNENMHQYRLMKYLNNECDSATHEFKRNVDDFLHNKTFRSHLSKFVKSFKPEPIRAGKPYELIVRRSGIFDVQSTIDRTQAVFLSESERRLFGYLCFLRTAELWCEFEELRNLHAVKKPLIVTNFLERLDESIDTKAQLIRTRQLNRQTIILTI